MRGSIICAMVLAAGCQFDRPTDVAPVDAGVFPPTSWVRTFASSGNDAVSALVVDASGNVFVTGRFEGNAALADDPFASAGQSDVFVASFEPRGGVRWIRRFGGIGIDAGKAIALTDDGRVAISGVFQGAVDFGDGLEPGAGTGSFVMMLSDDGTVDWVSTMRGAEVWALATAPSGRVFVELGMSALVTLDDGEMFSPSGASDVFVVAYSGAGQRAWAHPYGGGGIDVPGGIAAVGSDAYFAMTSAGVVDLGGGTLSPVGTTDLVVARVDGSDGGHLWSRRYGSAGATTPASVTSTTSGVAVVGCFGQTLQIGASSVKSIGAQDSFITMFDTTGSPGWLAAVGATGFDCAIAVASIDGGVVVGGSFVGDLLLGGAMTPSAGAEDLWLAAYTDGGVLRSQRRSGGAGQDAVSSISQARGFITLGGSFGGSTSVLGHPLQSDGSVDGFLLQAPE